jgi:hypothetical protein
MGEARNRKNKEEIDREYRRGLMARLHAERSTEGEPLRCQAYRCAWKVNGGRHDDPENMSMDCSGFGSVVDRRCAADWLAADPEDRNTYQEYLDELSEADTRSAE